MAELLNGPSRCSISLLHTNCQIPLCCCSIRSDLDIAFHCMPSSASSHSNLTLNRNSSNNYWFLLPRIKDSRLKPSKVSSLEFASVHEEEQVFGNNPSQPWGSFSDEELKDRHHSNVKPFDNSENELYYLEERDEKVLSDRLLKLSRTNKIRSALSLYRSMVVSGLLPNSHACNSLISCLLRNRRLDDALGVFEFVRSGDSGIVTGHTYSLILKEVAHVRGRDEALSMFQEAERDGKRRSCMDAIVYNTMITMCGKVNDWVQAERIWRSLQRSGQAGTGVTYRLLICIFARCGRNELALDAYHEMVRNGVTPGDDAMEAIVGACAREGKWDTALSVLQSMLNSETKPSLTACNALINSLGKASQVELAFEVYDLVKLLGHTPDAYTWNALLGALNRTNRHAEALRLYERIRREHGSVLNLHIYNTCLVSCQRLRLWDKAMQILWQMEASGIPVSVTSYNLVIGACEAARRPKVALQVYDHMIHLGKSPDIFTMLSLVRCCVWGSLWKEMEEILKTAPNGSVYNAAIQGACLRSKTDMARKLYMRMREIGLKPDGKTRALMLQNLPKR